MIGVIAFVPMPRSAAFLKSGNKRSPSRHFGGRPYDLVLCFFSEFTSVLEWSPILFCINCDRSVSFPVEIVTRLQDECSIIYLG